MTGKKVASSHWPIRKKGVEAELVRLMQKAFLEALFP